MEFNFIRVFKTKEQLSVLQVQAEISPFQSSMPSFTGAAASKQIQPYLNRSVLYILMSNTVFFDYYRE